MISTPRLVVLGLLVAGMFTALFLARKPTVTAASGESPKIIGSDKCRMCHRDQHQSWLEMEHANAWNVLTPEQVASGKDEEGRACIQCHTTGHGMPGGFVSEEKTPKLKGVGCESCHGPGSLHGLTMLEAVMKDEEAVDKKISRNTGCVTCHNPHVSHKKLYRKKAKE